LIVDAKTFAFSSPHRDWPIDSSTSVSTRRGIHRVRLGVDDDVYNAASESAVHELLAAHGVHGPFTLYAGSANPARTSSVHAAHRIASAKIPDLGSLVLVGPVVGAGSRPAARP